ncbi:MAG: hypothetical protein L3J88_06105 [Gammaproteobacteria bacterium]|nr:hypothetical protein [Gammaproteobacteria bacterium]MCF6362907.1 hypothetical protein [Gammaproteobacteria bacterium]
MKIGDIRQKWGLVGCALSLYSCLFWLFWLFNAPVDLSGYSPGAERFILPGVMIALGVSAAWASIRLKPIHLLVFSLIPFFSVGLYFLGGNSLPHSLLAISYLALIVISLAKIFHKGGL